MGAHKTTNKTMNSKKAIIVAQSSNSRLNTERVILSAVAIDDGYSKDNLIVIDSHQQLQQTIAADSDINAVYVYDVTGLGRRMDVICSVLSWLSDNHIQLVCYAPDFRLLERDGSVSLGGQMMIYLIGVMATS